MDARQVKEMEADMGNIVITKEGRFGIPPFCDTAFNIIVLNEKGEAREAFTQLPAGDLYTLGKICESLPDNPNVLEIGAFTGASTCFIGLHVKNKGGRMTTVDTFTGNPTSLLDVDLIKLTSEQIEELLRENLRRHKLTDIVTVVKASSSEFPVSYDNYDMVFLDGDHRYSFVMHDMEKFWPFINEGGILCGHDFDDPVYHDDFVEVDYALNKDRTRCIHHGVAKALFDFQSKYKVEVCKFAEDQHVKDSSIWYIRKTLPKTVQVTTTKQV